MHILCLSKILSETSASHVIFRLEKQCLSYAAADGGLIVIAILSSFVLIITSRIATSSLTSIVSSDMSTVKEHCEHPPHCISEQIVWLIVARRTD